MLSLLVRLLLFPNVADSPPKHADGNEEGGTIGQGDGKPHSVKFPETGQYEHTGQEKEKLACHALEDALASMADALEEVSDDHLCAYKGEKGYGDAEASHGNLCEFRSCSKGADDVFGEKLSCNETCCRDGSSCCNGVA